MDDEDAAAWNAAHTHVANGADVPPDVVGRLLSIVTKQADEADTDRHLADYEFDAFERAHVEGAKFLRRAAACHEQIRRLDHFLGNHGYGYGTLDEEVAELMKDKGRMAVALMTMVDEGGGDSGGMDYADMIGTIRERLGMPRVSTYEY